jgi:hypothetical protein
LSKKIKEKKMSLCFPLLKKKNCKRKEKKRKENSTLLSFTEKKFVKAKKRKEKEIALCFPLLKKKL